MSPAKRQAMREIRGTVTPLARTFAAQRATPAVWISPNARALVAATFNQESPS